MDYRSPRRLTLAGCALAGLFAIPLGCDNQKPAGDPSSQRWLHQLGTSAADNWNGVAGSGTMLYAVGGTSGVLPGTTGTTPPDGLVAQLDDSGFVNWQHQYGTAAADEWSAVTVDSTGLAYLVGYTAGTYAGQTKLGGSTDAVVASLRADGTVAWLQQLGTAGNDTLNAITSDSSGNLYVAGWTSGAFAGQTQSGSTDCFIAKYDRGGSQLWVRQFGSAQDDQLSSIAVGSDGSIYAAGWASASAASGQPALGGRDAVIYKLDATGSLVWARQFGSSSDDELGALGISGNNLYASGRTAGTLPGLSSAGSVDGIIASYDLGGNQRWLRQIGTVGDDVLPALTVMPDGSGAIVGGYVSRGLGGVPWLGLQDAIHVKMHSDGQQEWFSQFGTAANDRVTGLLAPAAGVLYSVGTTDGTFPSQTPLGAADTFFTRYQIP